jgi:[Skp1-protein]-hydroxyproline N-acetylglucosaminyltransferase
MTNTKTETINSWSSLTTRLLQEGGSSAWNVLDGVLGEELCQGIGKELDQAKLLDKLLPARTKGEANVDAVLTLLQHRQQPQQGQGTGNTAIDINPQQSIMIRGDLSLFLSREYRRRPEFSQRHPCLHRLISSVQHTVATNLANVMDMDLDDSMTSVQLAVYPGDGTSGYVRHCDRGHDGCLEEETTTAATPTTTKQQQQQPERIITAIFYLTDADWNARLDGGCLRLFHHHDDDDNYTNIVPYRDRLVVFRADGVEHQVLPSMRRSRTAITMWFYGTRKEHESGDGTQNILSATDETPVELEIPAALEYNTSPISEEPALATTTKSQGEPLTNHQNEEGPPPLPLPTTSTTPANHDDDDASHLPRIFVAISSYRDSETGPTLQSLFETAQHPSRVSVGLVLQLSLDDDDTDNDDSKIWKEVQHAQSSSSSSGSSRDSKQPRQIRCLRMDARDALGPCYARALCQSLHRGEDYMLQIDSHMRFRKHWDSYLIQLFQETVQNHGNNPKVVLTTYPVGYTLPNHIPNETRGTLLVPWKFDGTGLMRQRARLMNNNNTNDERGNMEAVACHLIAGGFSFAPASSILQDVPYDPNLHQLFFGEELSLAVRLYTHGYDLYAPPESVCYHLWSRSHRPTQRPIADEERQQRERSLQVVRQQLRGEYNGNDSRYGLGSVRTTAQFAQALGVDFDRQSFTRDDVSNGGLSPDDFADVSSSSSSSLYPQDSVEAKVASLDPKAQELIAFFLGGAK